MWPDQHLSKLTWTVPFHVPVPVDSQDRLDNAAYHRNLSKAFKLVGVGVQLRLAWASQAAEKRIFTACVHVFAGVPSLDGIRVMIKTVVLMMILLLMILMLRRVRVMTRHTHAQTPTHVLLLALLVGLSSGNSSRKSFLLGLSMTGAERARGRAAGQGWPSFVEGTQVPLENNVLHTLMPALLGLDM